VDIVLRPAPLGCLRLGLGIMSLGLIPLLLRQREGHFIGRMDEAGFLTRGGKRIAWTEVTGARRVQGTLNGAVMSDEVLISTKRGEVSLPVWRAENPAAVVDYAMRHLPPGAFKR
jgi:hypothetical protein